MTVEDAHQYLDMVASGFWVHPVVVTVALAVTGDIPIKNVEETYENLVNTVPEA